MSDQIPPPPPPPPPFMEKENAAPNFLDELKNFKNLRKLEDKKEITLKPDFLEELKNVTRLKKTPEKSPNATPTQTFFENPVKLHSIVEGKDSDIIVVYKDAGSMCKPTTFKRSLWETSIDKSNYFKTLEECNKVREFSVRYLNALGSISQPLAALADIQEKFNMDIQNKKALIVSYNQLLKTAQQNNNAEDVSLFLKKIPEVTKSLETSQNNHQRAVKVAHDETIFFSKYILEPLSKKSPETTISFYNFLKEKEPNIVRSWTSEFVISNYVNFFNQGVPGFQVGDVTVTSSRVKEVLYASKLAHCLDDNILNEIMEQLGVKTFNTEEPETKLSITIAKNSDEESLIPNDYSSYNTPVANYNTPIEKIIDVPNTVWSKLLKTCGIGTAIVFGTTTLTQVLSTLNVKSITSLADSGLLNSMVNQGMNLYSSLAPIAIPIVKTQAGSQITALTDFYVNGVIPKTVIQYTTDLVNTMITNPDNSISMILKTTGISSGGYGMILLLIASGVILYTVNKQDQEKPFILASVPTTTNFEDQRVLYRLDIDPSEQRYQLSPIPEEYKEESQIVQDYTTKLLQLLSDIHTPGENPSS